MISYRIHAASNGAYLEDGEITHPRNYDSWARDPFYAEMLWELSEKLVGEKFAY